MFKNKKFGGYAILFMILGTIYMFVYSGLQNDHINIIQAFNTTWSSTKLSMPMTVGAVIVIFFYLICGTAFIKFGVTKFMVPCTIILALTCVGIAIAGDTNYTLYAISLGVMRVMVVPLQMGGFMLCANWFIKYRGRIMGIITLGSPLFSVVGTSGMTSFIQNNLKGDYRPFYIGIGIVVALVALATAILMKDTPEQVGLYPDGERKAPSSEADAQEETMTLKQVLSEKRAWQLIISYGVFQFVINAMMSSMVIRYISLAPGDNPMEIWLSAVKWLSIGAILGIPMSFIFGVIDDKFGSIKASLILGLTFFLAVIPMMIMPVGGSTGLMICWGFGVACMTGGVPTMHPCITAYAYGRKQYQAANRWIMTIQAIPFAFSVSYMTLLFDVGMITAAYVGLIIMLVIAIITVFTMWKMPDANAAERAGN